MNERRKPFLGFSFSKEFKRKFYKQEITIEDLVGLSPKQLEKISTMSYTYSERLNNMSLQKYISKLVEFYKKSPDDCEEIVDLINFLDHCVYKGFIHSSLPNLENKINFISYESIDNIKSKLYSLAREALIKLNPGDNYSDIYEFNEITKITMWCANPVAKEYFNHSGDARLKISLNNLDKTFYSYNFSQHIVENNPDFFFSEEELEEISDVKLREKIFNRNLDLNDLITNIDIFAGKNLGSFLSSRSRDNRRLVDNNIIYEMPDFMKFFINHKDKFPKVDAFFKNNNNVTIDLSDFKKIVFEDLESLIQNSYSRLKGFVDWSKKFPDDALDLVTSYGELFNSYSCFNNIVFAPNLSKKELIDEIDFGLYESIVNQGNNYNDNFPKSFKNKYPGLFLDLSGVETDNDLPKLKWDFYNRSIDTNYLINNEKYINILKKVDLAVLFPKVVVGSKNGIKLVESLQNQFPDYAFDIMLSYSNYIEKILQTDDFKKMKFSSNPSKVELIDILDLCLYKAIVNQGIFYKDNLPKSFKDKYPGLFLDDSVPEDIRNKFYNRELTFENFINDGYLEYFKNTNVVCGLNPAFSTLIDFPVDGKDIYDDNVKRLNLAIEYSKIIDQNYKDIFSEYIKSNHDYDKAIIAAIVAARFSTSNSLELHTFGPSTFDRIMDSPDPLKAQDEIENIFLKNNLPFFIKQFEIFKLLDPELSTVAHHMSVISPQLRTAFSSQEDNQLNKEACFNIIYNDLLRIAVKSGSKNFKDFLNEIEIGSNLMMRVMENKTNYNLTVKEEKNLDKFLTDLEGLYSYTEVGKKDRELISNKNTINKVIYFYEALKPEENLALKDKVVRLFAHSAGYNSFDELKKDLYETTKVAHNRNVEFSKKINSSGKYTLKKGDFIRGVGSLPTLSGSLTYGNFSNEYTTMFNEMFFSDSTPLDTDFRSVEQDNLKPLTFAETGFGPIYVVIKGDNPNLNVTRDEDDIVTDLEYEPQKIEMFNTLSRNHFGARTGFALTDIECIVSDESISGIGFEIAKSGYYIPVCDSRGKLIFTIDQYNELRDKMSGLKYYSSNSYNFSDNLYSDTVYNIVQCLDENIRDTKDKADKLMGVISKTLNDKGLEVKDKMDGDLSFETVEVLSTGSTSRYANLLGDGDFDYIVKLDRSIISNPEALATLRNAFLDNFGNHNCVGDPDIKRLEVEIDGKKMSVDISFEQKTDKMNYSTEMCLEDRYDTIEKQAQKEEMINEYSKDKYVRANVILAKMVLKNDKENLAKFGLEIDSDVSAYGKNADFLSGVAVENWILQNGGSFYDACKSFLKTYDESSNFNEFKEKYPIWDFGENHYRVKKRLEKPEDLNYTYDNFVGDNLNSDGCKIMAEVLRSYVKAVEMNKDNIDKSNGHKL